MMQRDLITKNYAAFLVVQKTEHRKISTFTAEEVAKIQAWPTGIQKIERCRQPC
mgnify:CR=1 FL=1